MSEEQSQAAEAPAATEGQGAEDNDQSGPAAVEQPLSAEELKVAESMTLVAVVANRLVGHDPRYGRLVASMLASRQLYAMCLYELERVCGDTNFKQASKAEGEEDLEVAKELDDEQLVMLKEILISSAAVQAQQPFDEKLLFNGMVNTVFPWMRDVVALHTSMQNQQRKAEFTQQEAVRVTKPIAFNVQFFPKTEESAGFRVPRQKPVLFVGSRPAVMWLLDHVLENALKKNTNVEQILRLNAGGKPKHSDSQIWYVPKSDWQAVAETNMAFQRLYEQNVMSNLIAPVDLLIVDDLIHARNDLTFAAATTKANESQKKFKRWAEAAGCLLVGCLPLDRDLRANELNRPEFETLRMHNIVRGVATEKIQVAGEEWCKLSVGQHEVARFPIEELDAYRESKIIQT
jgi:hypothetical protein